MRKNGIRSLLGALGVVMVMAVGSGCTEGQRAWHLGMLTSIFEEKDPVAKAELQAEYDKVVAAWNGFVWSATAGEPCPQWFEAAMQAGFTVEQWQEPVARIMRAESNCDPNANNNVSTADGLMQILTSTWESSCPDVPMFKYDPQLNLDCAYRVSGGGQNWRPWVTW